MWYVFDRDDIPENGIPVRTKEEAARMCDEDEMCRSVYQYIPEEEL